MSPYAIRFSATARRQLAEGVPESVAFAAFALISGTVAENPHRVGKRLMPPFDDRWSARRGTYRIIYRIDDESREVMVLAVVVRSDAYRRP